MIPTPRMSPGCPLLRVRRGEIALGHSVINLRLPPAHRVSRAGGVVRRRLRMRCPGD